MVSIAPSTDLFLLQFECDPPVENRSILPIGDWALCGTDRSRRAVLRDSTFALVLAPADRTYTSTALLQARLYEALRSGAIPVLLGGDSIQLPYDEVTLCASKSLYFKIKIQYHEHFCTISDVRWVI